MPAPLLDAAGWERVESSAVALQSLRAAADAHGLPYMAVLQRAHREHWPVGKEAEARRKARRDNVLAEAAANGRTIVSSPVMRTERASDVLDWVIHEQGRQTRAMLSQGLLHAAGQARKTKHPLRLARDIKAVTDAASTLHGWTKEQGSVVQIGLVLQLTTGAEAIEC